MKFLPTIIKQVFNQGLGLFLLASLFISTSGFSQNAYQIEATVKGTSPGQKIILANYLGGSLYTKDTCIVDKNGKMLFQGKEALPQGIYSLVLPDKKTLIRVLISDDQTFSMEADTNDIIGATKVSGSPDNELFYGYQQFMKAKADEYQKLTKQPNPTYANLQAKQKELIDARQAYHEKFMKDNANTFAVKLFKVATDPEIPPAPKLPNGKIDSTWQFYYYRNHFWDNFDFTDDRLTRTPIIEERMQRYIGDLTVQTEDSLIKSADAVIKKAIEGKNRDMISYVIWYISNRYENPKVVGTEGVFVHVAEKYYLTGIMPMSDSATTNESIRKRLITLKPLLVNRVIPNVGVMGTQGKLVNIHDGKAIFKVIIFYAPSCSHCREHAPKLRDFYEKNKINGVEVMTISTQDKEEDWKKFIKEYKWENMTNCYGLIANREVDYRKEYDVYATPTLYVIDENNKIIARRIGVEDLEPYFKMYLQGRKSTKNTKTVKK